MVKKKGNFFIKSCIFPYFYICNFIF